MFAMPLLAGLVGLAFGGLVLRQYAERRRPYQAAWGGALLLFGAAALWEAAGAALAMGVISLLAVPAVLLAPTDAHLLQAAVPGRGAIGAPATIFPPVTNTLGSILLIGGAAWSAYRAYRKRGASGRVLGTALLAAGALIVAATHTYAQVRNLYAVQPVGEAIGILVMFAGYLAIENQALPLRGRSAA